MMQLCFWKLLLKRVQKGALQRFKELRDLTPFAKLLFVHVSKLAFKKRALQCNVIAIYSVYGAPFCTPYL